MTRETKSYELKIYDQSLMRFEAAYDAFGSLKLEITDIDSANAHLLPLNLIVDQDEKSLASWMEGRTIPKNRAFVEQILSTAGLTRNDILGILDVSKGLSINDSYWLDDGKSDVTFDGINLFDNRFDEVLGLVAYTGYTPSQKHKAGVSSEWTLGGQFPKAVRRINDRLLLFKTGTSGTRNLGKEPYSEYFAAQVAKRMGIDHVSYDLEMWKGKLASVCGLMNDFKSGHGLTFRGDANWLVCPPDLAQTLYETRQLPKDAAVFCPDARGRLQKKFDLGIGSGSSRIASVSELLFRMVNHSAYSYRTSRGVFSNGYCPWCSPYRAKLLNDIDDVCGDMDLIEGIELALDVSDPQGVHLSMSHDNGIDCAYIPINYCPICGRNFRKDR